MTAPDLRTIGEVAALMQSGAVSPTELVENCLAQIQLRQQSVNAFTTVLENSAREDARKAAEGVAAAKLAAHSHRRKRKGELPVAGKFILSCLAIN